MKKSKHATIKDLTGIFARLARKILARFKSNKNSSKYLTLSTISDRRGAKLLVRGRLSIRIEACQKKIQAHYIPTSYALTAASLRTLLGAIVRSPICQIGKKKAAVAKISKS